MAVVAYSPIARGAAKNDQVLARIGKAHGKTAAQVCLRYLVQQDIVVIPRTSKRERLAGECRDLRFCAERNGNERNLPPGASRRPHRRLGLFGPSEMGLRPSAPPAVIDLLGGRWAEVIKSAGIKPE